MTELERLIELLRKVDQMRLMRQGIKECADYLLANGVIVLPCKLGDAVYEINKDCFECNHFKEYGGSCCFCNRESDGSLFEIDYDKGCKYSIEKLPFNYALLNYIGKTVFLTKEEAEKAFKGA